MFSYDEKKFFDHNPTGVGCSPYTPPQSFPEKVEHTAIMLREALERLHMFEKNMQDKYNDLFSIMTKDNVTFKDIIQKAHSDFVSAVRSEINLFETNSDVMITTYKEAVNAELERFNKEYAANHEELTAEIAGAIAYMKTAINENLTDILHDMSDNNEVVGIVETSVLTSVKKYGAIGNGINDDTAAIQNALNACKNVLVPSGVYVLTAPITINANNHIKCEDGAVFLNCHNGAFFVNGEKGDKTTAGYNGRSNITFEGGTLDSNYPINKAGRAGIAVAHARDINIRNVTFKNITGSHAVEIAGCKNVIVDNCRFEGFFELDRSYIEAVQIELTHPEGFLEFGLGDHTPCENVRVTNCYFGASAALPAPNVACGHHGATYAIPCNNIVFANNIVKGCTYAGIRANHWENVRIENNEFVDCVKAVMIDGVSNAQTALLADTNEPVSCLNVEVGNNSFIRCDPAVWMWARQNEVNHEYAEPKHIAIKENRAADCTMFFYGSNANGLYVLNNTIENCSNTAISANNVKNANIDGNAIVAGNANMIQVKDIVDESGITKNVTISGNKLSDNKYIGVYVRGCDKLVISDNTFQNCGKNTDDYPVYIHNFVNCGVITGNVFRSDDVNGKGWGCIFGEKNHLILVSGNIASNYDSVELNSVEASEIKNFNNYAI